MSLRNELRADQPERARARVTHYRPLCDKDGYPLVGNVARKTAKPEMTPSEICAFVRERTGSR